MECNQRLDILVTEMRGKFQHIPKSRLLHFSMLLPRYMEELDEVPRLFVHEETKLKILEKQNLRSTNGIT